MSLYQMAYAGIQIYSFLKIFMTILSDPFFLGAMLILKKNDSCAARVEFPSVLFLVVILDTHSVKLSSDLIFFLVPRTLEFRHIFI